MLYKICVQGTSGAALLTKFCFAAWDHADVMDAQQMTINNAHSGPTTAAQSPGALTASCL